MISRVRRIMGVNVGQRIGVMEMLRVVVQGREAGGGVGRW